MTTLHIEHPVTDFGVWKTAFDRFAEVRGRAGVRGHRILRPVDDEHFVFIDLDFDSVDQAREFLAFLHARVWASADNAPALAGTPQARILEAADVAASSS